MVSMYYVFFGIFLVSMLFVPASISTSAAQDSEIPAWIKNNAGWWADGQIDDDSFLKGIKYLMDNLVLQIPMNQQSNEHGVLKLDSFQYELPKAGATNMYTTTAPVDIFGKFFGGKVGTNLILKVTKADGETSQENLKISKDATSFTFQYVIKSDFPLGKYQITISAPGDIELGDRKSVV